MEELIKELVIKLSASSGAIMGVDNTDRVLRCGASYYMPDVWVKLVSPLENTPDRNGNGRIAIIGLAEIVNGYDVEFHGYRIGSIIIVPVKKSDEVVANIQIISDNKNKIFTATDQKVLELTADAILSALR